MRQRADVVRDCRGVPWQKISHNLEQCKETLSKRTQMKLEVQLESAMPCKSRSSSVTASLKTFKDPIKSACDSQ